jgi:cobalamin biosynthesis Mg chelatase CobN
MSDAGESVTVRCLGAVGRRSVFVALVALAVVVLPLGAEAFGASPVVPTRTPVHGPGLIVRNAKKAHNRRPHKKSGRKVMAKVKPRSSVSTTSTSTTSSTSTSTTTPTAAKVRFAGYGSARPHRKAQAPSLALASKPASSHHGMSMTAVLVGLVVLVPMLIVALALLGSELSRRSRTPRKPAGSWMAH